MTTLVRKNQNWLPSIFNDLFDNEWMEDAKKVPAVNIKESKNEYTVDVAALGMEKEDCKISIDEHNNLVISMEKSKENKTEDKEYCYLRKEFSYSKYQKSFILPEDVDVDKIEAKVQHGILSVTLPKFSETERRNPQRMIEIQ